METIRIYKITSTALNGWCYVGSTKESLNRRWGEHKTHFKRWQTGKLRGWFSWWAYAIEIEDYYLDTFAIELIVEVQVDSKETRFKLEGEYIVKLKSCNQLIAGRNISENKKIYYLNNRKQILDRKNKKYICICGGKYTGDHKTRHERTTKHKKYLDSQN